MLDNRSTSRYARSRCGPKPCFEMPNQFEAAGAMRTMGGSTISRVVALTLMVPLLALDTLNGPYAYAAPTAEVAKRCLRYAYELYPYKRPGSVPMSGDRQVYFKNCIVKESDLPTARRATSGSTKD